MITENDLQEQIEKYQGQIDITPDECVKLAAMYILRHFIYPSERNNINIPTYSLATAPEQPLYDSGSEFSEAIIGMNYNDVISVIDELMEATYVYNKPLYNATIRKLNEQG